MIISKPNASPLRLAELAIENGWPADEVAEALAAIVGATDPIDTIVVETSTDIERSKVLGDVFARASSRKR